MAVVVAIDAGTTGVRALAMDESGRQVGVRYAEFPQHFPRPGWVEHDPNDIWESVRSTLNGLVEDLDEPVAALGITDQRETVVVWDRRTGEPRHRAIVWQDRRTAGRCDELEAEGRLPLVRERTGLVLDPYFSATKIEWLLRPSRAGGGGVAADDHLAVGTVDTWLLWKLTGGEVYATEPSNASRTMLFDIRSLDWSDELSSLFGVPRAVLPEVRPSCGRFGTTVAEAGVPAGIPISGVAGDQQAALFGQACFEPGMTKNTYGTGSFVLMNVGDECPDPVNGLLTTVAWCLESVDPSSTTYALEGAIFSTGATIQWLRDGLKIIDEAADTGPLAESVPDSGGVYVVPAFTGLGSPWWDPYARAAVVGITRGTTRAHLARATVESMAFQTRDVVDAMAAASGHQVKEMRVDGGASVMPLLLQLQADQLQVPVSRPVLQESTALGAAYLAGLAEGVWSSPSEVTDNWMLDTEVAPAADRGTVDAAHAAWLRAVERSRDWATD
jgi:glycerol kinase